MRSEHTFGEDGEGCDELEWDATHPTGGYDVLLLRLYDLPSDGGGDAPLLPYEDGDGHLPDEVCDEEEVTEPWHWAGGRLRITHRPCEVCRRPADDDLCQGCEAFLNDSLDNLWEG